MGLVQSTERAGGTKGRPAAHSPRLIAAGPAISLSERWRSELAILQRRSPASDAAATLADCLHELVEAINAGDDVTLKFTIADAHAISRIPVSTLRWLCKHKPLVVGARKREGVWYLDRVRFQEFIGTLPSAPAVGAAPDTEVPVQGASEVRTAGLMRVG
ncbi:MAG TPA: hypothetical protein VN650_09015 [Gemmatimonadaceae bacterium]|nr:hypothetical protein [Gemmatimonadaceae bacterium]